MSDENSSGFYRALFEATPSRLLVLDASDYRIVSVNDAYLQATGRSRDALVGRPVYEAFPGLQDDPAAGSAVALRESLRRVKRSGTVDHMGVQHYPVADARGQIHERHWSIVNTPVKDAQGRVAYIIHRVEDVTALVLGQGQPEGAEPNLPAYRLTEELRLANDQLRQRERQLANAQRIGNMGSWELDVARDRLTWSDHVYRIFGVSPADFAQDFAGFLALVHPDDRDAVRRAKAAAVAGGQPPGTPVEISHRIVRPDGEVRYVHELAERSDAAEGPVLSGTVLDVTDLMAARERSQQLAERLRQTLDNISDAFFTLDAEWRMTFVNREACRLVGRTADQLLGRSLWEAVPGASGTRFERLYRQALASGRADTLTDYFPPLDKWFEVRAYPTGDGLAVYFRDVSAERAQQAQLLLLETAVSRLNDIVMITEARPIDLPGPRIVYVNDAFVAKTGFRREEVLGQTPRLLQGPDTQRDQLDLIRRALIDNTPVRAELTNYTKQGVPFRLQLDIVPIFDDAGAPSHFVSIERDVTRQRELESQLRQAQRLDAVGQLTGGVAHDFNNLLTVILGNAELLHERLAGQPALAALADMTRSAAERGAELTSRLLAFARRQALDPRPTDVNRLLADMDPLLRRALGEHIHIEMVCGDALWHAMVDPAQLESAVLNLCINARDAMPDGGHLMLETANVELTDESEDHDVTPGAYVVLAVTDTGVGMSPEVQQRAFEPFFTTKDVGRGSGLGLSMVYGFARQSAGHVRLYSEPDHGTTVRLYLPRAASAGPTVDERSAGAAPVGGSERVLLVEDDALVRGHIAAQLEELGYRVVTAADGPTGLTRLAEQPFDLLITDVVMPGGMNGRELADAAARQFPHLPVLFTSGYAEDAIVHQGRLDPDVELLSKPFRRPELAAKVRRCLDRPRSSGASTSDGRRSEDPRG